MFHLLNFLKNANLSPEFLSLLKYISALLTSFCSKQNLKQKHQKHPVSYQFLKHKQKPALVQKLSQGIKIHTTWHLQFWVDTDGYTKDVRRNSRVLLNPCQFQGHRSQKSTYLEELQQKVKNGSISSESSCYEI